MVTPGFVWIHRHLLCWKCIRCSFLVTQSVVKQEQTCYKSIRFPFKNIDCIVYLCKKIITRKPSIAVFPCLEKDSRLTDGGSQLKCIWQRGDVDLPVAVFQPTPWGGHRVRITMTVNNWFSAWQQSMSETAEYSLHAESASEMSHLSSRRQPVHLRNPQSLTSCSASTYPVKFSLAHHHPRLHHWKGCSTCSLVFPVWEFFAHLNHTQICWTSAHFELK